MADTKYYLVTMDNIDENSQDLKSGTLTVSMANDEGNGIFVAENGTIDVQFTLEGMTAGADAAIKAQLVNSTGATSQNFPNGSAAELIASGAQTLTTDNDTITIATPATADITLQYQLSA